MKRQKRWRLGNYWIIKLLGRGGFANVYLGEHISLHTFAAIKVLNDQSTSENLERFLTEAYITANLSHRHIVHILDFDEESSPPFLVMEYVPNESLHGERLPLSTIVSYVKQISGALDYAHGRGIIHCDVKPNNALLDAKGNVKLIDFGIAVITDGHGAIPQIFGGTATYTAPEQYRGRPVTASDQYSLGVMVYEWLSGYPPFFGSSSEIAMQHAKVSPPPLSVMAPRTVPAIQLVVSRALKKDPVERFSNMGDFALALERASQEDVDTSIPVSSRRYQHINRSPYAASMRHTHDQRQRVLARHRRLRGVPQQRIIDSGHDTPPARYISRRER